MKTVTLREVLLTQDMGEKGADKLCSQALEGYRIFDNPLDQIIINTFNDNIDDYESMETDFNYAIKMLTNARNKIKEATN